MSEARTRKGTRPQKMLLVSNFVSLAVVLATLSSLQSTTAFHRRPSSWGNSIAKASTRHDRVILIDGSISSTSEFYNAFDAARILRGGAKKTRKQEVDDESDDEYDEDEDEDEYDDAEEEEYDDDEYDAEDEEDEEEESNVAVTRRKKTSSSSAIQAELPYDEPLMPSPFANLFCTFGVMMLARRVDLFHPTIVRIARFAFIAYLIVLQLFVFYVRIEAKLRNDRTKIELSNPLSSVLQNQLGGGGEGADMAAAGGGGMMKNLASSLLSSQTTVLEYDLKQARSMQSGLIFNMLFMWVLHFKMEQVQPLLVQTATGLLNLVYSPLFQAYILHRNLKRPFANPSMPTLPQPEAEAEESSTTTTTAEQISEQEERDDDDSDDDGPDDAASTSKKSTREDDVEEEDSDSSEEVDDEVEVIDDDDDEPENDVDVEADGVDNEIVEETKDDDGDKAGDSADIDKSETVEPKDDDNDKDVASDEQHVDTAEATNEEVNNDDGDNDNDATKDGDSKS